VSGDFWGAWKDFEVRHGNEDTIREMLRIKRSIQAMYNTQFTAHLIQQQQQQETTSAADANQAQQNPMAALNSLVQEQLQAPAKRPGEVSFVRGDTLNQPAATQETRNNPDEIELDEDEDEEEGGNKGII
jgi:pre-mRNA-splicing factor SYF1